MMFSWLEKVFARRAFLPFEVSILESVIRSIGGEVGLQLQQQVDAVNHVQRLRAGREVNLYHLEGGKESFANELRFNNAPEEQHLADVILRIRNSNDELNVQVWMAGGRIFSLEFDRPPNDFFLGKPLLSDRAEIIDVAIVNVPNSENGTSKAQ